MTPSSPGSVNGGGGHVGQCLIERHPPSSIPPDNQPCPRAARPSLTQQTTTAAAYIPPPSFTPFAPVTLAKGSINTRLDLLAPLQPLREVAGIVLRCLGAEGFLFIAMAREYTPKRTMAPFQDVPCTIRLCSARCDWLGGSVFRMQ